MKRKSNIVFVPFFLFCFLVKADPIFRINNHANQNIDKFGTCKNVQNESGKDIMVPTNSSGEWSAFLAHLPAGVTIVDCIPYYKSQTQKFTSGNPTCSCNKPSGLEIGDLMIAYITEGSDTTSLVPPSGFTQIDGPSTGISASYYSQAYTKVATAADVAAASFVMTLGHNFSDCNYILIAYRAVNQTTPIQDHSLSINTPSSTTYTMTSVTSITANNLAVGIGESVSTPVTAPAGFTSRYTSTNGYNIMDKVFASAGATGNITATDSFSGKTIGRLYMLQP
jgi:hypothetical protein